jgi:hypothetical protein
MRGKENILSHDWGLGAPPGVVDTNFFKAKYYGYFYAKFSGTYSFYISKEPGDLAKVWLDTTATADPSDSSTFTSELIDDWGAQYKGLETSTADVTLTEGSWYPLLIEFAERRKDAYICVRYREPDGVENSAGEASDYDTLGTFHPTAVEHRKTLSAGVFAHSDAWDDAGDATLITGINIDAVSDISYSQEENQSNILTFSIPLSTADDVTGLKMFRYEPGNGLYYSDNGDIFLRQGRLIKYSVGYASGIGYGNDDALIQRFTGIITDIDVDRSSTSSVIKVKCQDILYNAITDINRNYPNKTSYVSFDFTTNNSKNQPAGLTRPTAYDSWPLVDAVRDLFIKSNIDPTLLYGREQYVDTHGVVRYGDYTIQDQGILLRSRPKYGNPLISNTNNSDDEYIWSLDFGEPIYDAVSKMSDNYGFVLGVTADGNVKCASVNTPNTLYTADADWKTSPGGNTAWETTIDIKSDKAKYIHTAIGDNTTHIDVKGASFVVNVIKDNIDFDSSTASRWDILSDHFPQGEVYDAEKKMVPVDKVNYLYGRESVLTWDGNNVAEYDYFKYYDTTLFVFPTRDITVEKFSYKFLRDFPSVISDDYKVVADVYMGPVVQAQDGDLVTSSLVIEGYYRGKDGLTNLGDLEDVALFDTPFDMVAGTVYGIKFVSRETGELPQFPQGSDPVYFGDSALYSLEGTHLEANSGSWNIDYMRTKGTKATVDHDGAPVTTGYSTLWEHGDSAYGKNYPNASLIGYQTNPGGGREDHTMTLQIKAANSTGSFTDTVYEKDFYMDYADKTNTSQLLRYPNQGKDYTGVNPCKIKIYAKDLVLSNLVTTGNTINAYNDYRFRFTNVSEGQTSRISSIEAYDEDVYNPAWHFQSSKNIKSLGISETIDDSRNDIIVIGDFQGAAKNAITDEVVNANNPTLQYVYSRATDVSSINNPNSKNSVGRNKPFLVFEPSITDQRHADWLSQEILNRYRSFRRTPNWSTYGVPLLEPGDNVSIVDSLTGNLGGANGFNKQWVISIAENVSDKKYDMNIQTTPYEPWASFSSNVEPDINDFDGESIINIRMTDSKGNIRGYQEIDNPPTNGKFDVYEAETGSRLMLKYDQVIDGDLIVKVMSKNVLGDNRIQTVSYLVGSVAEGVEIPEYREWGADNTLYWDGIDQTGRSRELLGQFIIETGGRSVEILGEEFVASYNQPGFYAASGDYFLRFIIIPRDKSIPAKTTDTLSLPTVHNQPLYDDLYPGGTKTEYEQTWQIYWSDPLAMSMSVSGHRLGTERDITYYPDNVFHDDEYTNNGVLFNLTATGASVPSFRQTYYSVDLDHIWSLGYTFMIRDDDGGTLEFSWNDFPGTNAEKWKDGFVRAIGTYYKTKYGILTDQIDVVEAYKDAFLGDIWSQRYEANYRMYGLHFQDNLDESNYPMLELQDKYLIKPDNNDPSRWRVVAWNKVPYTTYTLQGYIPPTAHAYTSENPISFHMNPINPVAGNWVFNHAPDISAEAYIDFVNNLTIPAYFAGMNQASNSDERLKPIISHSFQIGALVWDNTGRILRSSKEAIGKPVEEHVHKVFPSNGGDAFTATHSHNTRRKLTLKPKSWNIRGGLEHVNEIYDRTTNLRDNYGAGYCNIPSMPLHGMWTWHGYWLSDDDIALDYRIPYNHFDPAIDIAKHWARQHGDSAEDILFHWKDGNKDELDIYMAATDSHSHAVIYEGANQSPNGNGVDYKGIMDFAFEQNQVSLAQFTNYVKVTWDKNNGVPVHDSRWNRLEVKDSFPNIWYESNITMPWSNSTNGLVDRSYWQSFISASGLVNFPRGGFTRFER